MRQKMPRYTAPASIALELKILEYKKHSYALLLLCQFFPYMFTKQTA